MQSIVLASDCVSVRCMFSWLPWPSLFSFSYPAAVGNMVMAGLTSRGCDIFAPSRKGPVNRVGGVRGGGGGVLFITASTLHPTWSSCALRTRTWSCGILPSWLDISREVLCQLGQSPPLVFRISQLTAYFMAHFFPGLPSQRIFFVPLLHKERNILGTGWERELFSQPERLWNLHL